MLLLLIGRGLDRLSLQRKGIARFSFSAQAAKPRSKETVIPRWTTERGYEHGWSHAGEERATQPMVMGTLGC